MRQALRNGDWDAKPPGKMFRREWFIPSPRAAVPRSMFLYRVRFWDLAATQEDGKKNPSWTCGVRMCYDNGLFYVEDVIRARETPGTVKDLVMQTAEIDGADVEVWIEQEPGSSGIAVIADYIRSMPRFAVRPFNLTGRAKEVRAMPFASQAEARNVRIIEGNWNEAFLEEIEQFPSGTWKNDQVDACAGAYNVLSEGGQFLAPSSWGERAKPDWNMDA
jgi:predicted phage terminase large subunit-like protein